MWLRVKTKRKLFFCYIYIFLLLCTCIRVVHTFMYVRVLNVFNYMCTIYHAVKPCTPPVPQNLNGYVLGSFCPDTGKS